MKLGFILTAFTADWAVQRIQVNPAQMLFNIAARKLSSEAAFTISDGVQLIERTSQLLRRLLGNIFRPRALGRVVLIIRVAKARATAVPPSLGRRTAIYGR